jgi:hypothetical protein
MRTQNLSVKKIPHSTVSARRQGVSFDRCTLKTTARQQSPTLKGGRTSISNFHPAHHIKAAHGNAALFAISRTASSMVLSPAACKALSKFRASFPHSLTRICITRNKLKLNQYITLFSKPIIAYLFNEINTYSCLILFSVF